MRTFPVSPLFPLTGWCVHSFTVYARAGGAFSEICRTCGCTVFTCASGAFVTRQPWTTPAGVKSALQAL